MMSWRTNAAQTEDSAATTTTTTTGDINSGPTARKLSSSETDPNPPEDTAHVDAEYGETLPAGQECDDERRKRDRLQLSPLSRTALTIRTMAGAAIHPKSGGDGTTGSRDCDPPPPAPPWRFSRGTEVSSNGKDATSPANETSTKDCTAASSAAVVGILADPIHHHSFARDSSLLRPLWGTVRRCTGCNQRLRTFFGPSSAASGGDASGQTVRCAACGALAHRGCAFSSRNRAGMPSCEVNAPLVAALESSSWKRITAEGNDGACKDEELNAPESEDSTPRAGREVNRNRPAVDPDAAVAAPCGTTIDEDGPCINTPKDVQVNVEGEKAAWDFQSMSKILQENIVAYFSKRKEESTSGTDTDSEDYCDAAETSKAENDDMGEIVWKGEANIADRADAVKRDEEVLAEIERRLSDSDKAEEDANKIQLEETAGTEDVSALLDEVQTKRPSTPPKSRSKVGAAFDLVRTANRTDANMRMASVAGSIAGGVAGLALAGPAGAMVGAKLFQTAGVLGVLIDGTMSVGVVVAGARVGRNVAESVSAGERVLTIGGRGRGRDAEGSASRLVLVRPNVIVDPVWEELAAEAKRSAPAHAKGGFGLGASFVANHRRKVAEMAQKDRQRKDANIVGADEYEIPTEDKVVLLVSSSLNDKHSLPGHVYRCLVAEYRSRAQLRKDEAAQNPRDKKSDRIRKPILALAGEDDANRPGGENCPSRAGRRDAHGVIKYVTATLLETRPGFGSSPRLAERTAAAVEALVFGELYADVFGEIVEECREIDEKLLKKIGTFEAEAQRQTDRRRRGCAAGAAAHGNAREEPDILSDEVGARFGNDTSHETPSSVRGEDISVGALEALLRLPEATAPADKLALCVEFLECVSVHFSTPSDFNSSGAPKVVPAGADNLLKMVCEHVLVAKVPCINAELTFLEEFARDEQLLRGREGYALVTLQAALHYLNASDDLERDIFQHCGS